MQIRFLHVTGPKEPAATVEFGPGLNVIYGSSNSGKTHILRLIDFALGARNPPEPVVEQDGYDLVHLGVVFEDGEERTFVRSLQGGEIRSLDGLTFDRPTKGQGVALSAQHGGKDSLSKFLLAGLGASGARIRTNAKGKTRDLSFRDLIKVAIVDETEIQDAKSPILSGQYVTRTAETSVFKFLLTGVDDSSLDLAQEVTGEVFKQAAQLELLDQQLRDLDREIAEGEYDFDELSRMDQELDTEIAGVFLVQESTESVYRRLNSSRRSMRADFEELQSRIAEIDTLLARFTRLIEHYISDHQRLEAVIEAGVVFALEDGVTCPICGAKPADHNPAEACEGNVDLIVAAAKAELNELASRKRELELTIEGLTEEQGALRDKIGPLLARLDSLDSEISREIPSVRNIRSIASDAVQRKIRIQRDLELSRRRSELNARREELGVSPGTDSSTIVIQDQLNGRVLDEFCRVVEDELKSWSFPDADRVFFEIQNMDISVSGKPRKANGKGVRSLQHGAFSIGLMKYCYMKGHSHPGFLFLDSMFITYRDPDDLEDAIIGNSTLKDRAFSALASLPDDIQLIVLENVDVPEWLSESSQCLHFSGRSEVGRAGLFPTVS